MASKLSGRSSPLMFKKQSYIWSWAPPDPQKRLQIWVECICSPVYSLVSEMKPSLLHTREFEERGPEIFTANLPPVEPNCPPLWGPLFWSTFSYFFCRSVLPGFCCCFSFFSSLFPGSTVQKSFLLSRMRYFSHWLRQKKQHKAKARTISRKALRESAGNLELLHLKTTTLSAAIKLLQMLTLPPALSPSGCLSVSSRSAPPAAVETRSHHGRAHPTADYQQEWESGKQRITTVTLCRLPPKHPRPPATSTSTAVGPKMEITVQLVSAL